MIGDDQQRLLPQAPEIERAVLGSILLERSKAGVVFDILRPDSFHVDAHKKIFGAISHLAKTGQHADILTVTEELMKRGQLEIVGGPYYISQLTNKVASHANLEYHARIISQKYMLRELIRIGSHTVSSAYDDRSDVFDVLRDARSAVDNIYHDLTYNSSIRTAADDLGGLIDNRVTPPGYDLGISALDKVLPLQPGLPYIFAGRPGIGKSIVACSIAWHMTLTGHALLISPEMTLRQVQARIVSMESGVPYSTILARRMNEQQVYDVAQTSMAIADRLSLLQVDETSGITHDQAHARMEKFKKETNGTGFVLDHLHKMATGDRRVDKDETPRVSQCMEGLTNACKQTGLYGIIMCQLNRQVEARSDRRPKLSDLKQTGRIEEDAAGVVLLYRDGYYSPSQPYSDPMEMAVAKNRDGPCDTVTVPCIPALSRLY